MPPITKYNPQVTKYDSYEAPKEGKKVIVYHTNWANYGRDYQVSDLPIHKIDDVCYAFFNLRGNGEVFSGDTWADFDKRYGDSQRSVPPPDSWNSSDPFYGNFGQFYKLKKNPTIPNFNLILSVGGWSWSKYFSSAVLPQNRDNFVQSLLTIFNKYPIFSGVSLDWEYCTNDGLNHGAQGNEARSEDMENFIQFCKSLREALDGDNKSDYKISTCCSANPLLAKKIYPSLSSYIDEFHIMTYDFMGFNGQKITGHHTNLKSCDYCDFSVEKAVEAYLELGIPSQKLFIGAAFYSRGFKNSLGPGKEGDGVSSDTTWETGIVDYKQLPIKGATEYWDPNCLAPFSYDAERKVYNSYDNVNSIYEKSKYVWDHDLGGIIVWESSADLPIENSRSLIRALNIYLYRDPRLMDPPPLPPVWKDPETPETSPEPLPETPETPEIDPIIENPGTNPENPGWKIGESYKLHDVVEYKSKKYKCIVAHTSNAGWAPDIAITLWSVLERPAERPVEDPKESHPICDCVCKKIKTIRITGDIDMSNVEIVYEDDEN